MILSGVLLTSMLTHPVVDHKGYILEVNMEYPAQLHKAHNSYPLAPEKLAVDCEWLSPYKNAWQKTNLVFDREQRLC